MADTLTIAVIGTAGRGADGDRLTADVWPRMLAEGRTRVAAMAADAGVGAGAVRLVTGGAAWADHIAVTLFLAGEVGALTLHLPAPLDAGGYVESTGIADDVGASLNALHRAFEARTGVESLAELYQARAAGADVCVWDGRSARNTAVAADADVVLAYTFGPAGRVTSAAPDAPAFADPDAAGLGEPSTADTWRKAERAIRKVHVSLVP